MTQFLKSIKSLLVGSLSTVISMLALYVLVAWLKVPPAVANLPTLALGSIIQFLGNRQWVFLGTSGKIHWQALVFILLEVASFTLNGALFKLCVVTLGLHYLLSRLITTSVVFWGFSFPLWKRLFS